MAVRRSAAVRNISKRLVVFLLFLFCFHLSGQEDQETEPMLTWYVEPEEIGKGDRLAITIIVNHNVASEVELIVPAMPNSLRYYSGPSKRYLYDYKGGRDVRYVLSYRGDVYGRHEIPPFKVIVTTEEKKEEYATDPIYFGIGVYHNRTLKIPPEPKWLIPVSDIFVGETLPLQLMVYHQPEIGFIDEIRVTNPDTGLFVESFEIGVFKETDLGDRNLYNIPVASYLFTPSVEGTVKIPSARIYQNGVFGTANALSLNVSPLPAQVQGTGAIGHFEYSAWIDATQNLVAGEPVSYHILVTGRGNLNFLQIPEPVVSGGAITDYDRIAEYRFVDNAFEGSIESVYTLYPEEAGTMTVTPADFWSYNRVSGVTRDQESPVSVKVTNPVVVSEDSEQVQLNIEDEFFLETYEQVLAYGMTEYYNNAWNYLLIIPAITLLLVFIIIKKKKFLLLFSGLILFMSGVTIPVDSDLMKEAYFNYESSQFSESQRLFSELSDQYPLNPGLYYNAALAAYRSGDIGNSVFYIRKAIGIKTLDQNYRYFLERVEDLQGLQYQIDQPFFTHPDHYFFLVIGAVSLFALSFIFLLFRRNNRITIIVILCLFLVAVSVIGMGYTVFKRSISTGVVASDDTIVYKIPSVDGAPWFELRSGTSLQLIDESGDFLLIETGYHTKGWVHKKGILTSE